MTSIEIQTPAMLLTALNAHRVADGKEPIVAWRSRYQAQLDEYEAKMSANTDPDADRPDGMIADEQADAAINENNDAPDSMLIADDGSIISEDEFLANQEAIAADNDVAEIAKTEKLPAYKVLAHYGKSKIEEPVKFIHGFLDANPTLTRKQAVSALCKVHGINYSTARTQFQKWFSKNRA